MKYKHRQIRGLWGSCTFTIFQRTRTVPCLALALVIIAAASSTASAEYIFIKDGSIIEGAITGQTEHTVSVSLSQGGKRTIANSTIIRTLYRNDFLYRQSVKLYSGETFRGFLVDETQDAYKFRTELFSTSERIVKKDSVIYLQKKELYSLEGVKEKEYSILDFTPVFILRGAVIVPAGDFASIYRLGYGGGLGFDFSKIRKTGWGIGIDAGCWYMQGVQSTTSGIIGSAALRVYYEFALAPWFGIAPVVSGGYTFNYIKYTYRNIGENFRLMLLTGVEAKKKSTSFNPIMQAGVDFLFRPGKNVALAIEARYDALFENKKVMHMVSVSPCVRFMF